MKKRFTPIVSAIIVVVILNSCSGLQPIADETRIYDDVELNKTIYREIGESLILTGVEKFNDAIEITKSPSFMIDLIRHYPYGVGDVIPLDSQDKKWYFYYKKRLSFGVAINKNDNTDVRPVYGKVMKKVKDFEVRKTTSSTDCQECYKQEFIYNGKVNNHLKFIYREYVKDMARPAFFQELQYDLEEGNIVGFKGLRIEVEEVTNTKIKYKVLKSFDKFR